MRGKPFNLQGKGFLEVAEAIEAEQEGIFWRKKGSNSIKEGLEPRSVLDNRRSPSPPTSTSTLSSSLGGGGGSSDTAGVAAVSDNPTHKWASPNSTSSAVDGGVSGSRREEWASELQPISASMEMNLAEKGGLGFEDLETMLSESAASPGQEQTFLRWIMGDVEDPSGIKQQLLSQAPVEFEFNGGGLGGGFDPGFGFDGIGGGGSAISPLSGSTVSSGGGFPHMSSNRIPPIPQNQTTVAAQPGIKGPFFGNTLPTNSLSLPPNMFFQESMEEKPHFFGSNLFLNQQQQAHNPAFFLPLPEHQHPPPPHLLLPPQPKRHHPVGLDPTFQGGQDLFLRRNQSQQQQQQQNVSLLQVLPCHLQQRAMKPKVTGDDSAAAHHHQQQQALIDQLFKVAELVEVGNFASARGILARLNHQLPSPIGKPLLRSAFYFKEALHLLLANSPNPPSSSLSTPLDVVNKLETYKSFSEISPLLQFAEFTCIQAMLEELSDSNHIHIIDFDIGFGGQWSSFMKELSQRRCTAAPSLKITAFASPSSHHPLELHLTRVNLSHFAEELNIPFEFNVLSLDSFDPATLLSMCNDETIAVNLPLGSAHHPSIPSLLRLVKQLSPKIVVSVEQGCDRSDLPFSNHFLYAFQSCTVLLDSIDAAGTNPDVANKIERFLLQPRIESVMLGRYRASEKILPWRTLFASAGFVPMQFSNFTETQAECLLKRIQVRGFHVEKRQTSLILCWQRGEIVSVSAWRC